MSHESSTGVLHEVRRLSEEIRVCDRQRKELVLQRRRLIDENGFASEFEPVSLNPSDDFAIDRSTSQLPPPRTFTEDDYDKDFGENDSNGNA